MAEGDGMGGRAAAYIDQRFRDDQRNLILEQQRQEQRELAIRKGEVQSFARNREQAELRHAERLRSIEAKRDRIADDLHRRHNSLGGRLAGMTKAGRARQAGQLERLNDRAAFLQARAERQFQALGERQFQAEQKARIAHAREIKTMREEHRQDRQQHAQRYEQTRARQIEDRTKTLQRQQAEQALRLAPTQHQQDRGRSLGH